MAQVVSILADPVAALHWVSPDMTAYDALSLMAARSIAAVLVLESGELRGIFSGKDYCTRVTLLGRDGRDTSVGEVMTSAIVTVDPRATVTECMQIMTTKRCRHMPIMENGKVVGLVTLADLVRHQLADMRFEIDHLTRYITG